MQRNVWRTLGLLLALWLAAALVLSGCGTKPGARLKEWAGYGRPTDDEEVAPPEAQEEQVMVDGKPYVRSRNPYYLTYPNQPEYFYVEKGREFVGLQQHMINALAKALGREQAKAAKGAVPPDKLQELVRQEVDRVLREQGLGGFVSRGKTERAPYTGRAVAVFPNPDAPRQYDGLNRTLALGLAQALARQKDIKVMDPEQVRSALGRAKVYGKLTHRQNLQALGDATGVQALVLTGVYPPDRGGAGVMALEVYDTFLGNKVQAFVQPADPDGLKSDAAAKFAQANALRVAAELVNLDWFGRVEFVKEGKVYLSLGQNAGLKVGDRLKVVSPGKEVVNPTTHASLGFTADVPQGDLRVTELLGDSGAVATVISGGPFKPNDKVKAGR
ncbi:MAG: hypothetical protein FJ128_01110 [Deltaproteobacteria bacterium]|nr:hypothetical protein [Deltaproteobacteria bacterium]